LLEYHAPRGLLDGNSISADQELIDRLRNSPLPENLDPRDARRSLEAGAATALDLNDLAAARKYVGALEFGPESAARDIARGRLDLVEGDPPKAESSFEAALRLEPDSVEAMHWLAVAEHRTGNDTSAQARLSGIEKRSPRFLPALNDQMQFAIDRKDYRAALEAQLTRIAVIDDPPAYEYCRLGAMWVQESNPSEAESALLKGLLKDPYSYLCHFDLANVYASDGRLAYARQNFEWVVRYFPAASTVPYEMLAGISSALGDSRSEESALRKGRRLFPDDPLVAWLPPSLQRK
jgi:tetratricopeptide (TPR) repeat protein